MTYTHVNVHIQCMNVHALMYKYGHMYVRMLFKPTYIVVLLVIDLIQPFAEELVTLLNVEYHLAVLLECKLHVVTGFFFYTPQSTKILGEIPASRMEGAAILGDKNNFHRFVMTKQPLLKDLQGTTGSV